MLLVDNLIEASLLRRYVIWICNGSSRSMENWLQVMRYCEFIHLHHFERDISAHKEIWHIIANGVLSFEVYIFKNKQSSYK